LPHLLSPKRVSYQPYVPIIATLFFCLYPADTTFSYLQHLFGLQTSLLFLLIAFHCYLSAGEGHVYLKILSYLMSILSLLTYESPFLTFLVTPFLLRNKSKKQIIIHFCIVGISLFSYLMLRKMAGEQRVVGLGTTSLTQTVLYQILAGPLIAVATYFLRPLELFQLLKHENILILPLVLSFLYLLINYLFSNEKQITNKNNTNQLNIPELLAIGTAITILAYPSALTLSVNIIDGRASRVHFAASLGTAIILSCLWNYMIIKSGSKQALRKLTIFLLALHLSLLFVFLDYPGGSAQSEQGA
jgi:positive regulator of sigma E activity